MLTVCRQYFRDNDRMLRDIENFDENYHKDECIQWYTKETFIYKLINKALRTEDIVQLYIFRYYIADLSKQLAEKYKITKNKDEKKILLYRGLPMDKKEVQKLKINVGKLIAGNSYWSTSRSRKCALEYANKLPNRPDMVPVLFEIECDLQDQTDSVIFADISGLSEFSSEEEFLFDAGSIFQIQEVKEEEEMLYVVQIRTSGKGRELATQYIKQNRRQMQEESPRIMLSTLLKRMGKFKQSLEFLRYLEKNPADENIAYIYNRIGIALKDDSDYGNALIYFKKAFKLTFYSNPPDKKYSAYVLHNQGLVYAKQRNYTEALGYYCRAVNILEKEEQNDISGIATFYSSIGRVYLYQGNLEKALEYQLTALQIRECIMPDHVMLAFSYADIANIYSAQKNYKFALTYHCKALELRNTVLPPDSHNTAWSLHQVGKMYYKCKDLQMAREHYLKCLQIYIKYIDTKLYSIVRQVHQDILLTYVNDYSEEAFNYRLEALNIQRNPKFVHYPSFARLLDDIAFTYKSKGSMEDSLKFYEEALQIRKTYLNNDRFNLAHTLNNLASVYEEMGEMRRALNSYDKIMKMCTEHYCSYHWLCKKARRNIGRIRQMLQ